MGDRVTAQSDQSHRLEDLGAEVSASLEDVRKRSGGMAERERERVKMKLVTRQKPRLRLVSRSPSRGDEEQIAKRRIFVRSLVTSLAFAASVALVSFVALSYRSHGDDPSKRAQKDPVLSFVIGEASSPTKQEGTVGAFIAATNSEMPVTFSDGSKLRLAPAARVRVAEVANNGARVHLESGMVHVAVVHHEATRWAVEAGPYEVRVTGTKFDVAWDPSSTGLVVKLEEGSVYVRGCGLGEEGRKLTKGEELRTTCDAPVKTDEPKVVKEVAKEVPAPQPTQVVAPPPVAVVNAPPPVKAEKIEKIDPSRSVAMFARHGSPNEALAAADANGFSTTCDSLEGPDLLLLADAARYAGRFDRATEALTATRRRFAGTDAAATAAFELGRIEMDVHHDLKAAGDHFETYLRERPSGSLSREALGRAIEARQRAGESARAERLAVRYLAAYPDGPHAKLARKLTAPETTTGTEGDGSKWAPKSAP